MIKLRTFVNVRNGLSPTIAAPRSFRLSTALSSGMMAYAGKLAEAQGAP
jgi:hypothetical protein